MGVSGAGSRKISFEGGVTRAHGRGSIQIGRPPRHARASDARAGDRKGRPQDPIGDRSCRVRANAVPHAGSSLFTAIQEQLGLKRESRKGPVEILVIDHIESAPTAN
ncbi:MAG TPA: TIGR03435 family protein [Verrucomicrobiae bacterium]|nr:TIGR03435 family protein [Verrucomicrobiae bacterium]